MEIVLTVTAQLEREYGKFVGKDELADLLVEEVSSSLPDTLDVDDSTYAVETEVTVEEVVSAADRKRQLIREVAAWGPKDWKALERYVAEQEEALLREASS